MTAGETSSSRRSPGLVLLLSVLVFFSLLSCWHAIRVFSADLQTMQARWQLAQWQKKPNLFPDPKAIGQVRNQLTAGLAWLPGEPHLLEGRAYLYAVRAARASRLPDLHRMLIDETITDMRRALARRPMSPYAWVSLATALEMRDGPTALMWSAFDRAMAYGQRENGVQVRLLPMALRHWDTLGGERQASVKAMLQGSRGASRAQLRKQLKAFKRDALLD